MMSGVLKFKAVKYYVAVGFLFVQKKELLTSIYGNAGGGHAVV
jgi:hypothetical protein